MNVMPRKSRIDAPGALHHIIVRGIERRKLFVDDVDRNNFAPFSESVPRLNIFIYSHPSYPIAILK